MTKKELAQYQALKALKRNLKYHMLSSLELADLKGKSFTSKDVNTHLASVIRWGYVQLDYNKSRMVQKTYVNIDNPNDIITKKIYERVYKLSPKGEDRMKKHKESINNAVTEYLLTMAKIEKGGE